MEDKTLKVINENLSLYTINKSIDVPFGMRNDAYRYGIGYRNSELISLVQPPSADDAWQVSYLDGKKVNINANVRYDSLVINFEKWFKNEGNNLLNLNFIESLPNGKYFLIKSLIDSNCSSRVLLGNKLVWIEQGVVELIKAREYYSAVYGLVCRDIILQGQPLLGVPILDYAGSSEQNGVLFFSVSDVRDVGQEEFLLIIPIEGE